MGVKLTDLLVKQQISFEDLKGKKIAIDASNMLYQFLSSIRQADGTPLKDRKGNITSHLVGTFSRISNFSFFLCFLKGFFFRFRLNDVVNDVGHFVIIVI